MVIDLQKYFIKIPNTEKKKKKSFIASFCWPEIENLTPHHQLKTTSNPQTPTLSQGIWTNRNLHLLLFCCWPTDT